MKVDVQIRRESMRKSSLPPFHFFSPDSFTCNRGQHEVHWCPVLTSSLSNGQRASNGFQALADLDDNKDGKIDLNDAAYAQIKI